MKKSELKNIIKEEIQNTLNEVVDHALVRQNLHVLLSKIQALQISDEEKNELSDSISELSDIAESSGWKEGFDYAKFAIITKIQDMKK